MRLAQQPNRQNDAVTPIFGYCSEGTRSTGYGGPKKVLRIDDKRKIAVEAHGQDIFFRRVVSFFRLLPRQRRDQRKLIPAAKNSIAKRALPICAGKSMRGDALHDPGRGGKKRLADLCRSEAASSIGNGDGSRSSQASAPSRRSPPGRGIARKKTDIGGTNFPKGPDLSIVSM